MPLWTGWASDGRFQTLNQGQGGGFGPKIAQEGSGGSVTDGREGGGICEGGVGSSSGEASYPPHMKNHYSNLLSRISTHLQPNSDLN